MLEGSSDKSSHMTESKGSGVMLHRYSGSEPTKEGRERWKWIKRKKKNV